MYKIDNKFDIGETCWTIIRKPLKATCPFCKGTTEIEVPFKEEVTGIKIKCRNCCKGYIDLHQTYIDICEVRIRNIRVRISSSKSETNQVIVKYQVTPNNPLDKVKNRSSSTIFKTKEEAQTYCLEVMMEKRKGEF